jgi:hypothetical protein
MKVTFTVETKNPVNNIISWFNDVELRREDYGLIPRIWDWEGLKQLDTKIDSRTRLN